VKNVVILLALDGETGLRQAIGTYSVPRQTVAAVVSLRDAVVPSLLGFAF
jgi:hypothetical protein